MGAVDELRKLGERPNASSGLVDAYAISGDLQSLRKIAEGSAEPAVRDRSGSQDRHHQQRCCARAHCARSIRAAPMRRSRRPRLQGMLIAGDEQGVLALYRAAKTSRREASAAAYAHDDGWRRRAAGDRCRPGGQEMKALYQFDQRSSAVSDLFACSRRRHARPSSRCLAMAGPAGRLPPSKDAPAWCCWSDNRNFRDAARASCRLDGRQHGYGDRDDATTDAVRGLCAHCRRQDRSLAGVVGHVPGGNRHADSRPRQVAKDDSARWLMALAEEQMQTGRVARSARCACRTGHPSRRLRARCIGRHRPHRRTRRDSQTSRLLARHASRQRRRGHHGSVMFNDKDADVREHAAFALAQTESPRAAADLIRLGNTDKSAKFAVKRGSGSRTRAPPRRKTRFRGAQEGTDEHVREQRNLRALALAGRARDRVR